MVAPTLKHSTLEAVVQISEFKSSLVPRGQPELHSETWL